GKGTQLSNTARYQRLDPLPSTRARARSSPGMTRELQFLRKPMIRIRIVVERRDFLKTFGAIERLRFRQRPIGIQPHNRKPILARDLFQSSQHAPRDAEPA